MTKRLPQPRKNGSCSAFTGAAVSLAILFVAAVGADHPRRRHARRPRDRRVGAGVGEAGCGPCGGPLTTPNPSPKL